MIENNGWKWHGPSIAFPHAKGFYQKRIIEIDDDLLNGGIFAEIIDYGDAWEVEVNIPGDKWTKVKIFTYPELSFDEMESDAYTAAAKFLGWD